MPVCDPLWAHYSLSFFCVHVWVPVGRSPRMGQRGVWASLRYTAPHGISAPCRLNAGSHMTTKVVRDTQKRHLQRVSPQGVLSLSRRAGARGNARKKTRRRRPRWCSGQPVVPGDGRRTRLGQDIASRLAAMTTREAFCGDDPCGARYCCVRGWVWDGAASPWLDSARR